MTGADETAWLQGIEGEDARELISSDAPLIRVVAGPGAGKTTCLKRRTQRLIEGLGVEPDKVFVGTFTRAIARELRNELGEDVRVSTLHSLAYRLLRENPGACQGMPLRFLLQFEEDAMLYDVAGSTDLPDQRERRNALRRLQSARSEREEFEDAAFAGAVRDWLQRHGGMLIGEVVYLAVTGLESHDIPPGRYDHVVVDEYQDLTVAEQDLVELIWSQDGSLVVMGDNDQSIYSFRFNHPEGIAEFTGRWEDAEVIDLGFPANRRCGDEILQVANLMMAEAGSEKDPMIPASGRQGSVSLLHWSDVGEEVDGLAAHIREHEQESFLVLVPRRFIGYRLKDAVGDDARTAFHEEALEHPVAQERFALASVLADPDDGVALRSWLGFHGTYPVHANSRNAPAYANLPRVIDAELLRQLASGDIMVSGTGSQHLRNRARSAVRLIEEGACNDPEEVVRHAFDPDLARDEEVVEKRRRLEDNLGLLREAALEGLMEGDHPNLRRALGVLRYRIATRAPLLEDEDDEPRVRIMTLHSAKGLEAENIIIAGVADQVIPGLTQDPDEIAEQRRLLYVAITRARENLIISWARSVDYADARGNAIRANDVFTTPDGTRRVRLSRTSLVPQALPGGVPGHQWLQAD